MDLCSRLLCSRLLACLLLCLGFLSQQLQGSFSDGAPTADGQVPTNQTPAAPEPEMSDLYYLYNLYVIFQGSIHGGFLL